MLQIMNPKPIQLSHNGISNGRNIGIMVKCWENARPLIKELEQTVNFAERKCGDLMQQLNLCKEYYEKWSTERFANTTIHKRKPKKRFVRKCEDTRSSSENESETVTSQQANNNFNEKLRNKIFEITNEIKEANRKIVLKDVGLSNCQKENCESGKNTCVKSSEDIEQPHAISKPEPAMSDEKQINLSVRRSQSKMFHKRRTPTYPTRHATMQKYKLRSKSLPQGVRRKFGFGSFVEIVETRNKQRSKVNEYLLNTKARSTVSSGSKCNIWKEGIRPKSKPKSRASGESKSRSKECVLSRESPDKTGETQSNKSCKTEAPNPKTETSVEHLEDLMQNIRPCSSVTNDCNSSQVKLTYLCEGNYSKLGKQKSLMLAPRQPIPFTICRTSKTFNLGLNIQQVLSLIKSKRHSAMLQAIIKDNIRTARSVIQKTDSNIDALYIASSSRIGRTSDSEICPAREDGDHCYSIISTNSESTVKCKMLTCRQSVKGSDTKENTGEISGSLPFITQINFSDIQRPEDVWVVEQPDPHRNLQGFRARCTCFPSRHSVDYQKVLKQYSRMKQCEQKTEAFQSFPPGFCPLPSHAQFTYNTNSTSSNLELKKVQVDVDNIIRRYERLEEQVAEHNVTAFDADRELDTIELELNYREEDCKVILNFFSQVTALKKKVRELRGRIRSQTNLIDIGGNLQRSKKDPFRPTPSMMLTRVLRQIQCLQDKIKLIDSPSIT